MAATGDADLEAIAARVLNVDEAVLAARAQALTAELESLDSQRDALHREHGELQAKLGTMARQASAAEIAEDSQETLACSKSKSRPICARGGPCCCGGGRSTGCGSRAKRPWCGAPASCSGSSRSALSALPPSVVLCKPGLALIAQFLRRPSGRLFGGLQRDGYGPVARPSGRLGWQHERLRNLRERG